MFVTESQGRMENAAHKTKSSIKVGLPRSKKNLFICFNDSPTKMMKNAFYFILKALFVFKAFKFLSWPFGYAEKTVWLER